MFPKATIVRDRAYLRWVASQPCIACGVEGFSQAAHANYGKGMAMKTSDHETFPLCAPHWGIPGCHVEHDMCYQMTREQRRAREVLYIAEMRKRALPNIDSISGE